MDKIFETAAAIGHLAPYLESLHSSANQRSVAKEQWRLKKRIIYGKGVSDESLAQS